MALLIRIKTPPEGGEGSLFWEAALATVVIWNIPLVSHLNLNISKFCLLVQIYPPAILRISLVLAQHATALNNHNGENLCNNVRTVLCRYLLSYQFTKTLSINNEVFSFSEWGNVRLRAIKCHAQGLIASERERQEESQGDLASMCLGTTSLLPLCEETPAPRSTAGPRALTSPRADLHWGSFTSSQSKLGQPSPHLWPLNERYTTSKWSWESNLCKLSRAEPGKQWTYKRFLLSKWHLLRPQIAHHLPFIFPSKINVPRALFILLLTFLWALPIFLCPFQHEGYLGMALPSLEYSSILASLTLHSYNCT